ncbi:MAG: hypothetical protein CMN77_05110 [Spirochaetaceae bacterium]|nr:hypothetical protein [Spirochaetaceae bacterium]|tara:strand:- start:5566 stop:6273 length:708 start_codon:yes stop_codon:yes gene_type:complete
MSSLRLKSVITGALLLSGIVAGIFSSLPVLESPGYLPLLAEMSVGVYVAVFFQAMIACVYVGLACIFYTVLRSQEPTIAVFYFGFRIIGAAFLFLALVPLLVLLTMSEQYLQATDADLSAMQLQLETIAELTRLSRDWINHLAMILPWSIGGLFLYSGLLRSNLLPAWITWWGLGSSVLTLASTLLLMLGLLKIVTPMYFVLNAPTALLEITMAIYLFLRGFRTTDNKTAQPGFR